MEAKSSPNGPDVAKGVLVLLRGLFFDADVNVKIWHNHYYGGSSYFGNGCSMYTETLDACKWRYMVDKDPICWYRAILLTRFRYINRDNSSFWAK